MTPNHLSRKGGTGICLRARFLVAGMLVVAVGVAWGQALVAEPSAAYRTFPLIGSRLVVWGASSST